MSENPALWKLKEPMVGIGRPPKHSPKNSMGAVGKVTTRSSDPLFGKRNKKKEQKGRLRGKSTPTGGGSYTGGRFPEDWELDGDVSFCNACSKRFSLLVRKHHCRNCGMIFCADCSQQKCPILEKNYQTPVRVCGRCHFALSGNEAESEQTYSHLRPVVTDNSQSTLKHQIAAMEDVSQALMAENKELRGLVGHLQQIIGVQKKAISLMQQGEQGDCISPESSSSGEGDRGHMTHSGSLASASARSVSRGSMSGGLHVFGEQAGQLGATATAGGGGFPGGVDYAAELAHFEGADFLVIPDTWPPKE